MKLKPLYMGREEEDGPEWLTMDVDYGLERRVATDADITLARLAEMLDQSAEDANAHSFVGCHRMLAALLHQQVGEAHATHIFRRIAHLGGLHELHRSEEAAETLRKWTK